MPDLECRGAVAQSRGCRCWSWVPRWPAGPEQAGESWWTPCMLEPWHTLTARQPPPGLRLVKAFFITRQLSWKVPGLVAHSRSTMLARWHSRDFLELPCCLLTARTWFFLFREMSWRFSSPDLAELPALNPMDRLSCALEELSMQGAGGDLCPPTGRGFKAVCSSSSQSCCGCTQWLAWGT